MSKRLILFLALALAVGLTSAAYAEVQNVRVSGDLAVSGITRNSLTLKEDGDVKGNCECIKRNCEWFDSDAGMCAVQVLSITTRKIAEKQ